MNSDDHAPRIFGIAFLLEAITSLLSGMKLKVALIVPGNISESRPRIANHTGLMRANIFGEMATAVGVIFLGAIPSPYTCRIFPLNLSSEFGF